MPVDGGPPRRVTNGGIDHRQPAFSPDGKSIVYRSDEDGGGIWISPVRGGRARLLARGGERPRFAPDGRTISYRAAGKLFTVDAKGGEPRAIHPDFDASSAPVWTAEGALVFAACRGRSECDWWSAAPGAGPKPLGAAAILKKHKLPATAVPEASTKRGIVFTADDHGKSRLFVLANGAVKRLTAEDRDESSPAIAPDGRVFFASRSENIDVWTLPLRANEAAAKGALQRLTDDPAIDQRPSLSADGSRIAWETSRGGNFEVRVKDLATGRETAITNGPLREHMPAISSDGSELVYDAHDGEVVTIYRSRFDGGPPALVWKESTGQGSFQWTAGAASVLYFHREPPGTVGLMDLASKKRTVLLRHPTWNLSLADARSSPDGQWIAFPVPFADHRSRLAIAKVADAPIGGERDWTWLTPDSFDASQPEWSPDGRWLYYLSSQEGGLSVWASPVADGKAAGGAKKVLEFPHAALTIARMRPRDIGLAVAKDKLALGVAEYRGTLWSAAPAAPWGVASRDPL